MKINRQRMMAAVMMFILTAGLCACGKTAGETTAPEQAGEAAAAEQHAEVHKIIIDTDTGSDDAAALVMAATSENVDILGITVLYGNVSLDQAADNALQVMELCGCDAPVYKGEDKPLEKERPELVSVHGEDGMGDQDLVHPEREPESEHAVDFILETVKANPGEVEIVAIGPATNVAQAILKDPETMQQVKHIWSMGTAGFGTGNASPVAEFNVYNDAEAYKVMVESGLPVTIAGWDLVVPEDNFYEGDMKKMAEGNMYGTFLEKATSKLYEFGKMKEGIPFVDVPDALTMAALVWPECVKGTERCCGCVCVGDDAAYGQVIMYRENFFYEAMPSFTEYNLEVVDDFDAAGFKTKFMTLVTED